MSFSNIIAGTSRFHINGAGEFPPAPKLHNNGSGLTSCPFFFIFQPEKPYIAKAGYPGRKKYFLFHLLANAGKIILGHKIIYNRAADENKQ